MPSTLVISPRVSLSYFFVLSFRNHKFLALLSCTCLLPVTGFTHTSSSFVFVLISVASFCIYLSVNA